LPCIAKKCFPGFFPKGTNPAENIDSCITKLSVVVSKILPANTLYYYIQIANPRIALGMAKCEE